MPAHARGAVRAYCFWTASICAWLAAALLGDGAAADEDAEGRDAKGATPRITDVYKGATPWITDVYLTRELYFPGDSSGAL